MTLSLAFYRQVVRQWTRAFVLAAGALPIVASPLFAADDDLFYRRGPGGVNLQAIIGETGSWSSNPLLQSSGAKPLYGSTTSPELILSDDTPTAHLGDDLLVDENLFNQPDFNSTDVHNTFDLGKQAKSWMAGVQQRVDYDTTRTSELSTFGLNSAGVVRHLGLFVAPQFAYHPTEVDKISLLTSASLSQYDKTVFTDYTVFVFTPTYLHNFDERNAGTFSVATQRYQTMRGPRSMTDTIAPQFGWNAIWTPRLSTKVSAGIQTSHQSKSGLETQPWTMEFVFSGDLTFRGTQDTTDFVASRSEQPFGNGTTSLLTTVSVTNAHAINENFTFNLGASYQYADYQATATGDLKTMLDGTSGLTYHATEHVDIAATYQFRHETLVGTSNSIEDHSVTLGVVYRPTSWAL